MVDFLSVVSILIILSPIVIGAGAFYAIWLRDEFYAEPLYDDYEHGQDG